MIHTKDINIRMIIEVAKHLGDLRNRVVFVGGCARGLFITDPAMPEVRATQDADVIEDIVTILDGRSEIVSESRGVTADLRRFLSQTFRALLANPAFRESLPGHLSPDQ